MTEDDSVVRVQGTVLQNLPNATFKVEVDGGLVVLAHVSGKMRMRYIRILPGDRVDLELSAYDPTQGKNRLEIQMKVKPSTRRMCEKCRIIRRHRRVWVICENPRHKQRQG